MSDSGHRPLPSQRQPLHPRFNKDQKVKAALEWNCDSYPTLGFVFVRGFRLGDGLVD